MSDHPTCHGNSFRYELPNGWSFRMTFSSDATTLRMEGLTGESAGQALTFDITTFMVSPGIYFINWLKPDGGSVSHVHDYNTGTVRAFWSFDCDGERVARHTTGRITPVLP